MKKHHTFYEQLGRAWTRVRMLPKFVPLACHYVEHRDDWKAVVCPVPVYLYGEGFEPNFRSYLEGTSRIRVQGVQDICAWLRDCEYDQDRNWFRTRGCYHHPAKFEDVRKGVCADHAIWAWRKLAELGYPAELVVGTSYPHDPGRCHAWVVFESEGRRLNLESTEKNLDSMVQPLDSIREQYSPHCSVDSMLVRRAYGGMCRLFLQRRAERLWRRRHNRSITE